ncbi:unnamed protein product [Spirodela intermedia]|uniref:Uncharacterized protein n=1 Tax=Spirodela intermedia TaxID=51605 RepID=A0A7I8IGR0_SPIIN|nr:unnamed protein product [Spirodela intermedia]CAA6657059.1 unnamed protein product [Spirodela intermedia]
MPDNAALREGLTRALAYFPHLAGRFHSYEYGYPKVVLNDAGIRLKEAIAPSTLEEHLPFDPTARVEVLLQVQLTRFSCGGLTLGLTSHHRIGDSSSICHFLFTWAKLVQGRDVGTLPFFGWSSFDHLGAEFRSKSGATRPRGTSKLTLHIFLVLLVTMRKCINISVPHQICGVFFSLLFLLNIISYL